LTAALVAWALGGPAAAAEEPWTLPRLMALLSGHGDNVTRFVEEKKLAILNQPLRLEGTMEFHKPAYLAKHVLKPVEEHYIIDGDRVTVEKPKEGSTAQLSLADYPALQAFAASLRAPLAGDTDTLGHFYQTSLGGTREHWLLALAPLRPELAKEVRLMKLQGSGDRIERLDIEEASGDTSAIRFQPLP